MTDTLTKPTEMDVLREAVDALQEQERLRKATRANDDRLRKLCRQYGQIAGVWGYGPHHLEQVCRARGLL